MKRNRIFASAAAALLLIFFIIPASLLTQEAEKKDQELIINSWLALGPFPTPLPKFHDDEKKGYPLDELLNFEEIDTSQLKPREGARLNLYNETSAQWKKVDAGKRGIKFLVEKV